MSSISIVRKFLSLPNTSGIVKVKIGRFEESKIEFYGKYYRYLYLREGSFSSYLYSLSYTDSLLRLKSHSGSITIKIKITDVDDFINSDDMSLVLQYGRNILDENVISNISKGLSVSDFDDFLNQ